MDIGRVRVSRDDWKPRLSHGIKAQTVGNELILLDKDSRRVHQLDRVGARILACCDGASSVDGIVEQLLQEFDVSEKQLLKDVSELLERMRVLGILS